MCILLSADEYIRPNSVFHCFTIIHFKNTDYVHHGVFYNNTLKSMKCKINTYPYLRNRCSDRTFNFFKEGDLDFIEFRRALDGLTT